MQINGKVAIVTGGASGLGEATARRYAANGANVVIADMNDERGNAVADDIGSNALYLATDVTSEADAEAVVAKAVDAFGAVHIVNNFAGILGAAKTVGKEFKPYPLADFRKVIDVNLVGSFNVLRLAAAQMAQQEPVTESGTRGVIINTASIAGYEGQMGQAAYAASKGGIIGMTLCISRDLAQYGIRVNTLVPGLIHTPMFDSLPEHIFDALESTVLYPKRLGKPDEIAHLAQTIVENDYLNGECIRLDGGLRMQPR
ncbi:MAG: SDR family NAD(P)-dependent oxidoreductase [Pseudomonadota bacterium]